MWRYYARIYRHKRSNIDYYYRLLQLKSKYESSILKDVDRTFPHLAFFDKDTQGYFRLYRILKALSLHMKEIGYCQGMNNIAATILLNIYNEEVYIYIYIDIYIYILGNILDDGITIRRLQPQKMLCPKPR